MRTIALVLLAFIALYPVVTAAIWVAGGIIFRLTDERRDLEPPEDGWPPVTVLVPAYNEEAVIATCVHAALAVDYPALTVVVLDDGSTDRTVEVAAEAGAGDRRLRVFTDGVNLGKADRLNGGLRRATDDLVAVTDADTHLHPAALKWLVARIGRSEQVVAVAGAPHVTNRHRLLCVMQILEAAAIIGLIRRTHSTAGRVGTVAGVLGLFRRAPVLEVGGYDGRMATEDIDLSWRLLLAGWDTVFEPRALVGMQVPSTVSALWKQRQRWARGQGEVLHRHARQMSRWRNRRLWPLELEAVASLLWINALVFALVCTAAALLIGNSLGIFGFSIAWGIAIAVVSMLQLAFALGIDHGNDRRAALAFLFGPVYPIAYWLISGAAALRRQTPALFTGPREHRVTWNIPRERTDAEPAP